MKSNDCEIDARQDYSPTYQEVLQKNQYVDIISRSIYYSLGQLDIKPYSFLQIYSQQCFAYGYPFQYSGRVELASAYNDSPPIIAKTIEKMKECASQYSNYNFQCLAWYTEGIQFKGMYFSFPGFNGDSEYVLGLCQYFKSSLPNESFMDRQLCNAIKIEEFNNLIKKISQGLEYYYILDRQLQLVAMHSNYSFAEVTASQITWDYLELNYFTLEEKNDFISQLPEKFYKGKTFSDFNVEYEGEKNKDNYFVGRFTKQGHPFLFIAYQLYVLDTTPDDVDFSYADRVHKKKKTYKSYYTIFNVINERNLFASSYQLQQNIDNIYFILLFIQIAASFVVIIYSIYITYELANSLAFSIDILIYLLKAFAPEDHTNFSELKSMLAPFDQISHLFCSEIYQIYGAFKNLMHIITFRNKTTSIASLSDGQTLLDWVFACSFFENMMGNHTFLGISYNNLGNIHFNSHRYLEACQCYHISLIHLNYLLNELDLNEDRYTNVSISSNPPQKKISNINREAKNSSIDGGRVTANEPVTNIQINQQQAYYQRKTKATSVASILSRVKKRVSSLPQGVQTLMQDYMVENTNANQVTPFQRYQDLLHLKFERQYQYIRSQKMFFLTTNPQMVLWKEQIQQLKDLFHLDQILVPPLPSRTVMILLELSFCYLMKNNLEKAQTLINLSLQLFVYNQNSNHINLQAQPNYQVPRNSYATNDRDLNIYQNETFARKSSLGNNQTLQRGRSYSRLKNQETTIFSESQKTYLKMLQQTSPILQNPLILQILENLNIQKQGQFNSSYPHKRKNSLGYPSELPSPRSKNQSNYMFQNINATIEMIGLNKAKNNTIRNHSVNLGKRQTGQTSHSSQNPNKNSPNDNSFNYEQVKQNFRDNFQLSQNNLRLYEHQNSDLSLTKQKNQFKSNYFNQQGQNIEIKITNYDQEYQNNQSLPMEIEEINNQECINIPKYSGRLKPFQLDKIDTSQNENEDNDISESIEIKTIRNMNNKTICVGSTDLLQQNQLKINNYDRINDKQLSKDDLYCNRTSYCNIEEFSPRRQNTNNFSLGNQINKTNNLDFEIPYIQKNITVQRNKSYLKPEEERRSPIQNSPPSPGLKKRKWNVSLDKTLVQNPNSFERLKEYESQNLQNQTTDFPRDVVFSKIMLSLAGLFKTQGEILQAAQMATNSLEISTQYFALYRYESLQLINSCFSQLQIKSAEITSCLNKFNPNLFMSLSIIIDYGNFSQSQKVSKILRELCESEMKNSKDSFQVIVAREYCETLISTIYKDQYIAIKHNIDFIFNSLPRKINKLSKVSSNNRVNLFKPLTKILAQHKLTSIINENVAKSNAKHSKNQTSSIQVLSQKNLQTENQINSENQDKLQMRVISIFTDMKFPFKTIYNEEIHEIFQMSKIHLILFDVTSQCEIYPHLYPLNSQFEFIHLFSQPLQLINFFSNLREKTQQLGEPTFVQIL